MIYLLTFYYTGRVTSKLNRLLGRYASAPARQQGALCVVRVVVGQGSGSPYSLCLRSFSALLDVTLE